MVREQNKVVKEASYFLGNLIASSVPSRRVTTRHMPTGQSSNYRSGQTISFHLGQSGYLDVNASYIRYTLNLSDTANNMTFLSSNNLVQRLVVRDGQNNIIEDISNYHYLHNLFRRSMSPKDLDEGRNILYGSGFEDIVTPAAATNGSVSDDKSFIITLDLSGILGGSQIKYIPLQHIQNGLYVDITLAPQSDVFLYSAATADTRYYELNNVMYICDIVEFDAQFEDSFKNYLQEMPLELYYNSYQHHSSNLSSTSNSVIISEKASSIKDIYWVAVKNSKVSDYKQNSMQFESLGELFSVSLQLGNQRIPQYPMETPVEVFTELKKSFNTLNDLVLGGLVNRTNFVSGTSANNGFCVSFMCALNMEVHLASSVDNTLVLSGKDSKSVSQNMVLQLNNTNDMTGNTCLVWVHSDRIYQIDSFGKGTVSY